MNVRKFPNRCAHCLQDKPLNEFPLRGHNRHPYCRDCKKALFRSKASEYGAKLPHRFYRSKWRALNERKLPWELTFEEYVTLLNKTCYYCQKELIGTNTGIGLDRIDNRKGYTSSNVLPCCGECNYLRQDLFTVEETYAAAQAIKQVRGLL